MIFQQGGDDFAGGVGIAVRGQEVADGIGVVAEGDQRRFDGAVGAILGMADVGEQGVAEALASDGVFLFAAFGEVGGFGFGGASIADGSVGRGIGLAQVSQIADALALGVDAGFRSGFLDLRDFEGESGR